MDYKEDMNGTRYMNWFKTQLLPAAFTLDKKSVIILDRAGYHLMLCEDSRKPQVGWKKERLADYIVGNGGVDEQTQLPYAKGDLLELLNRELFNICMVLYEKRTKRYIYQDWLKEFNSQNGSDIQALVLPVAHPRLNPIEMCWGNAKNHVAQNNRDFTMNGVIASFKERIAAQGRESFWKKSYQKMREEMNLYIRMDEKVFEMESNETGNVQNDALYRSELVGQDE